MEEKVYMYLDGFHRCAVPFVELHLPPREDGMMNSKYLYALVAWIVMGIVANINGLVRNTFVEPRIGEQGGHVLSTVLFICAIVLITYYYVTKMGPTWTIRQLFTIGVAWVFMTILFEFIFGHYVIGHTWDRLLADYNILKGRIWVLVLVTTLLAPLAAGMMSKVIRPR